LFFAFLVVFSPLSSTDIQRFTVLTFFLSFG